MTFSCLVVPLKGLRKWWIFVPMLKKSAVYHMSFKMSYLQQVLQKLADKRNCRHTLIGSIQQNESKCADHCPGFGLDLCNGFSAVDTFSAPSPSKIWPDKTSNSQHTDNKVSRHWPFFLLVEIAETSKYILMEIFLKSYFL